MTAATLDIDGPAAPPRSNGELVFAAPWESRAFGLAMTLANGGVLEWDIFRDALIARIAGWERSHPDYETFSYYACWSQALEDVVVAAGLVSTQDLAARLDEFARRPAGWDHGHDHSDHDHDHSDHAHDDHSDHDHAD